MQLEDQGDIIFCVPKLVFKAGTLGSICNSTVLLNLHRFLELMPDVGPLWCRSDPSESNLNSTCWLKTVNISCLVTWQS